VPTKPAAPIPPLTTAAYVWHARRYDLRGWLLGGPDYSRAVEYPLVARLLEARRGDRLLDIGSGRRAEFATLMCARGLEVTAVDARADVGEDALPSSRVRFVQADARELPFEDASFERVTAISTIEHVEDGDDRLVRELARMLAPGGRLVITVPFNPLKRAELYLRGGVYGRTGERVFFQRVYDEADLERRIVAPAGLRVLERVYLGEPGLRLSAWFYDPRGPLRPLRYRVPWGPLFTLLAPLFMRPAEAEDFTVEDWNGVAAVLTFVK
jgi:SAM-dependent methyltransferase